MKIKTITTLCIAALLTACVPTTNTSDNTAANSQTAQLNYECKIQGKVVKVVDGDTAYVLDTAKTTQKPTS